MDTQLRLKKTPAHLAMQSQGAAAVGTAQGGENSRQVAGLHDGGSARAHNWIASAKAVRLVRREVVIAHVAPLFGSNEHERDQSQDGAHHVQQQVQFSGGDGLHGSRLPADCHGLAVGLAAKDMPFNVWTQVLAAHGSACRAFDCGTKVSRNGPSAFGKLADELRRLVQMPGQLRRRAAGLASSFNGGFFHDTILKLRFTSSQALTQTKA